MFQRYELFGKKVINAKEDIVLIPIYKGGMGVVQEYRGEDRIRYIDLIRKKEKIEASLVEINNKITEANKAINK